MEQAFQTVSQQRVGAVTIHENPRWETNRRLLADLAPKHRLHVVFFTFRSQAEAGGLMRRGPGAAPRRPSAAWRPNPGA